LAAANTFSQIASTTLGSAASTIQFASIPSTYTDLKLIISGRSTRNQTDEGAYIYFNNDFSGTTGSYTLIYGNGTSAVSTRGSNTFMQMADIPALTATSGLFGFIDINVMNYANTTTYKTYLSRNSTTATGSYVGAFAGLWRNTAAISTIDVQPGGGQWAIGTSVSLYGILAA
jgi:hypothetical protein